MSKGSRATSHRRKSTSLQHATGFFFSGGIYSKYIPRNENFQVEIVSLFRANVFIKFNTASFLMFVCSFLLLYWNNTTQFRIYISIYIFFKKYLLVGNIFVSSSSSTTIVEWVEHSPFTLWRGLKSWLGHKIFCSKFNCYPYLARTKKCIATQRRHYKQKNIRFSMNSSDKSRNVLSTNL